MKLFRKSMWLAWLLVILFVGLKSAHGQTYTARAAVVNPDQGKMGVYRSLTQLAYQEHVEKHYEEAGVLAQILRKVWGNEGPTLRASSPDAWGKIDKSIGRFNQFVMGDAVGASRGAPILGDDVMVPAYQQLLADLAAAD
jgi:hypothetical protein